MQEALESMALMLSPMVPHLSHQLWELLGHGDAVIDVAWPGVDESALVKESLQMVVQVNGKLRAKLEVAVSASKEEIEQQALADENVLRFIEEKNVVKVIVVPGKLVNLVVK